MLKIKKWRLNYWKDWDNEFLCYLGKLWIDSLTHFKYYIKKQIVKIRLLNKKLKIPWEGYYYFALTDKEY